MSLGARIQKLEAVTIPLKAEMERKRAAREYREYILNELKDFTENSLVLSRYVLGDTFDEEEARKDTVETQLLYHTEATDRFGVNEDNSYKATLEQLDELTQEIAMLIDRHFFNCHQTVEQYKKTQAQWRQARTDMDAGLPSAESEAAEEIRLLCRRYPRNMNAERFYEIWD